MRKTISIILLSSIIGSTVVSMPMRVIADKDKTQVVEKTEAEKKAEEEKKKIDDKAKTVREQGKSFGIEIGSREGRLRGREDFARNRIFDWEKRYNEIGDISKLLGDSKKGEYLEGFKEGFKEGFESSYNEEYMKLFNEKIELEIGYAIETGEKDAISDFYAKRPIDYKRHLLEEEEAIDRFKLNDEDDWFKANFYVEYMIEYKKAYEEKYRELRKQNFDIDRNGYEDGKRVGAKQGDFSGKIDFVTPKAPNNWEISFKKFESQKSVEERYFLNRESKEYKESFIIGFKEAYRIAYNEAYQKANIDIAENNINYVKVAGKAETLDFKPSDGVGNLGGKLIIENATFYQETHLGLSMDRDSFSYKNLKYKPVNHVYNVAVNSNTGSIQLDRPMTLELEYYGVERAGIYQLVNNEWKYIYTKVTDKSLEAEIPEGPFRGGKYAIFIDEDYKPIIDIKRHWAKDELYTFLRRDYIKGDKDLKYYPNANMSRGEFLDLLGKTLGWDYTDMFDNSSRFNDSIEFGDYKNAINYAANMGYISGTPEGNFKANDDIKYNQVEWILKKVLFNNEFKWDPYAQEMEDNRYTKPQSTVGKNQPIKKGEVVYMLHEIQKKNLM